MRSAKCESNNPEFRISQFAFRISLSLDTGLGELHTLHIRFGKFVDETWAASSRPAAPKLSWNEVFSFKQGREKI